MDNRTIINVLYVDDEDQNLISFKSAFRRDFNIFTAGSAKEAETVLSNTKDIHVLITDQRMPFKSGTELLSDAVKKYPNQVRILLTAFADNECLIDAINRGQAYRFMSKPWNEDKLKTYILEAYDIFNKNKEQEERIIKLQQAIDELEITLKSSVDKTLSIS